MNFIFYPFLFAIYPILFLFSNNYGQIPFTVILLPIFLAVTAALFLWFIINLFVKELGKSAFLTFLSILFFFSYGHFSNLMLRIDVAGFSFLRNRYRAAIYVLLFIMSFVLAVRSYSKLRDSGRVLNLISLFLILLVAANIGWKSINEHPGVKKRNLIPQTKRVVSASYPDIYYIILDGYARDDSLSSIYGRPYTELIDHLAAKGFYIAKESTSNYAMTMLSLASSLNMSYLGSKAEICSLNADGNEVEQSLRRLGYLIIDFRSGFVMGKEKNMIGNDHPSDGFLMMLLNSTMIDMVAYRFNLYAGFVRKDVMARFSRIEKVAEISGPKFVFDRIPSPHPPYVFGKDGEAVNTIKMNIHGDIFKTSWDDKQAYLDQLIFISKRTNKLVDAILSHSKRPPIIIVQADHGPQFSDEKTDFYKKRMAILNAYYVPEKMRRSLYSSITPVNSFRLIFRDYFGFNIKLLPDRNYFSTIERLYDFIEVTAKVNQKGGLRYQSSPGCRAITLPARPPSRKETMSGIDVNRLQTLPLPLSW